VEEEEEEEEEADDEVDDDDPLLFPSRVVPSRTWPSCPSPSPIPCLSACGCRNLQSEPKKQRPALTQ